VEFWCHPPLGPESHGGQPQPLPTAPLYPPGDEGIPLFEIAVDLFSGIGEGRLLDRLSNGLVVPLPVPAARPNLSIPAAQPETSLRGQVGPQGAAGPCPNTSLDRARGVRLHVRRGDSDLHDPAQYVGAGEQR